MSANGTDERRPLRIGIFIALLPPEYQGGAELQADRLARELAARGHEVHLFARRQSGRTGHEVRDGVWVHRRPVLPVPGVRLAAEIILGAPQAARLAPDVLLCYMTLNSGLLGAAASALCGAPFVVWQRLEAESMEDGSWERSVALRLNQRAAAVWLQSHEFVASLRRAYENHGRAREWQALSGRIRVLGNGLDMPPERTLEPVPPPRFLFIGRLVEQKRLVTLVAAAHRLAGRAEVWIAGEGPLRGVLESAAAGAAIRFLGAVPHARIPDLLHGSRGLVLCSNREGVPNVVLEALAHGRPVVATPVGAVPELVQDGVNGRIVPLGDATALAEAMASLLDDARWRALAAAARPSVERFAWPQLVDRVESELRSLVDARRTRRRGR